MPLEFEFKYVIFLDQVRTTISCMQGLWCVQRWTTCASLYIRRRVPEDAMPIVDAYKVMVYTYTII